MSVTAPVRHLPWDEIAALAAFHPASVEDSVVGRMPQQVAEPRNENEIAAVLKWANAHQAFVAPRGGGTKMDWGSRPRTLDLLLSTRAMTRVLEHAWEDLTVTVEPGCTIADLQRTLAQHGQRLAIDPLFPERATVGGVLASNDNGSLRTRFGSLRDLVIGITAALPDGTLARSGGKVVKNVAGYDLPKLFTGSLGTLGVIAQATFRLHPLPQHAQTLTFECATIREAASGILALQGSNLVHTSLQIRASHGAAVFVDVRFEGIPAGIDAQVERAVPLVPGRRVETAGDVWRASEEFFAVGGAACICRVSLLPSQTADTFSRIQQLADDLRFEWRATMQAVGVGVLRLDGSASAVATAVIRTREQLEKTSGSLVVLRCPDELRGEVNVWGSAGSALALMQRVKYQFDPAGILNPGRFIGGI